MCCGECVFHAWWGVVHCGYALLEYHALCSGMEEQWAGTHPSPECEVKYGNNILRLVEHPWSLADPGGLGARPPLPPRFFFKIMQFSGNCKGKPPILSKFWAQPPPHQNPGSGPDGVCTPTKFWSMIGPFNPLI